MNDVVLDHQVLVYELPPVGVIRQYASHPCGCVKDVLRLLRFKKSFRIILVYEVKLVTAAQGEILETLATSDLAGSAPKNAYTSMLVEASRHYQRDMADSVAPEAA